MRTLPSALVLVAGLFMAACASNPTRLDSQWTDPALKSKPIRQMLVMGITRDAATRRLFEDRMVAQLRDFGVTAVQSYRFMPDEGPFGSDRARAAVAGSKMSHVLVSRIVNVSQDVRVTPGMVVGPGWGPGWGGPPPGWGPGWGGFMGYQTAFWGPPMAIPPSVTTTQNLHVDTRIFQASDADVVWAAATTTTLGSSTVPRMVDQFVELIVATLRNDALI